MRHSTLQKQTNLLEAATALLGLSQPDKAQVHLHIERVVEHFLHSHSHQTVSDASGVPAC
ncbi:hypothetical protein [Shewanella mangrovisoli]|uniref:hypothetical protein n=1 Tax=Shewanella mangrovisoli TaxID=2864211 RepID=UPI0035B8DE30